MPDDNCLTSFRTQQHRDFSIDLKDLLKQRLERGKKSPVTTILMTKRVRLLKAVAVTHSFELTIGFGLTWMSHFFSARRRMPLLQLMMWLIVSLFCKANSEVSFTVPSNKYLMNLDCERERQHLMCYDKNNNVILSTGSPKWRPPPCFHLSAPLLLFPFAVVLHLLSVSEKQHLWTLRYNVQLKSNYCTVQWSSLSMVTICM